MGSHLAVGLAQLAQLVLVDRFRQVLDEHVGELRIALCGIDRVELMLQTIKRCSQTGQRLGPLRPHV